MQQGEGPCRSLLLERTFVSSSSVLYTHPEVWVLGSGWPLVSCVMRLALLFFLSRVRIRICKEERSLQVSAGAGGETVC